MQRLSAFAQKPASVCRRLCELLQFREYTQPSAGMRIVAAQALVLAHPGAVVSNSGEANNFWWVVVSGSVSVGSRETLSEGQAFGHGCLLPSSGDVVITQRCVGCVEVLLIIQSVSVCTFLLRP